MLKTERETAQARAKARGKIRRAKAKVKTASPKQALSRLENRPAYRKVRRRKAAPEAAFESLAVGLTGRLALLEPPSRETTSRLEARIPTDIYEVMERAATLRGLTMTAYITTTMGTDARRTIEESSIIKLSRDDQTAFAKALIDPPAPNAKLIAAARRHAALIR
jgi:uncharacterized protein (DUF1778 family)